MSYQQSQQECQVPAKCLPKCPPTCPPQAPGAPACCPAPRTAPARSCRLPTCCLSGLGNGCCLVSYRLPRFSLPRPRPSHRCEIGSSGCPGCCHGSTGGH
uniref:late cornified envelope protein 2D-like n=1 Tax=Jaculus jaculus TaxID=51337 RepID=UPI001E1B4687|nr:late cornified envelope protein 2D-like [Jaculus jaculus]